MDISRSYGETTLPDASVELLSTAEFITTPLAAAFRPTIVSLVVVLLVLLFFTLDFAFGAFLVTSLRRLRGVFAFVASALLRLIIVRIGEVSVIWIF